MDRTQINRLSVADQVAAVLRQRILDGAHRAGASDGRLTEIRGLVEKPPQGSAPSNLMLPGRYILQPEVMRALDAQEQGAGGEIQLTDAMARLIGQQPFHAFRFEGERYDCGSAEGFVIANIAMALARENVGPAVELFLSSRT